MAVDDRIVQRYDARSGQPIVPDPGHTGNVCSVAFSPDGRLLASGGDDRTARIWDLATGKPRHLLPGHKDQIWSLAFSPDGHMLASRSRDGTIYLWDPASGRRVRSLVSQFRLTLVSFSPDSRVLAAGTNDGGVQLWSARTGEEIKTMSDLHNGLVRCVAFSRDGTRLASGGEDGKVVLTDLETGKVLKSFQRKTIVNTLHFGPDQNTIIATYDAPDPVVRLWSIKDGECVTLRGHASYVLGLALRCDGRLLATGSFDDSVRLWQLGGDRPRAFVLGMGCFGSQVDEVALSPDGRVSGLGQRKRDDLPLSAAASFGGCWHLDGGQRLRAPPGLAEAKWLERVKGLSNGNLAQAVSDRLRELNPGFDGVIHPVIEDGVIAAMWFCTNQVNDISPIRALTGLRRLVCGGSAWTGKLANLAPLEGLHLELLDCRGTKVRDLTPLRNMPLRELEACGTQVADLSPLRQTSIEWLSIWFTPLSNLTPLKGLNLKYLNVAWTQVAHLSPLAGMHLEEFCADHSKIEDLTPLCNTKLRRLCIHDTGVSELTAVKDLPLRSLECQHTRISDLSPLRGTPLQELNCDFQPDRDATILRSIETLDKINGKSVQDFWKEEDAKLAPKKE